MLEFLAMLSKFLVMTFGGFFTPLILIKGIKQIEIENKFIALIASLIFAGALAGFIFIIFFPSLTLFLTLLFVFFLILFVLFVYTERESEIKSILGILLSILFYGVISWIYLPFPTGLIYSIIFFLAGTVLSFEDDAKRIILPLIVFTLVLLTPFVKSGSIKLFGISIPLAIFTHLLPFFILLAIIWKKWDDLGGTNIISFFILWVLVALFYLYPVPGLPPEVIYYGKVAGRGLEKQMQLYRRYLEIYRAMQQNETLRKLYGAGEYEVPEEGSLLLEPNKGLIISYKENNILKEWDINANRIRVEFIGRIENPLETPIQALIIPKVLNIVGSTGETVKEIPSSSVLKKECKFMKEELPSNKENQKLKEILEKYDNTGDIEIIYKKSFEPFECTIEIDTNSIPSEVTKVWFTLEIDVYYDILTSSILELDIMGKERYSSLLRFEKLKEKELKSYSTWGPLKGVINIFEYDKNPIPIEDSDDLNLYLYTINNVPSGNASMRCYILAVPRFDGKISIDFNNLPEGCHKVEDLQEIYQNCLISISEEDSLYYGFTIYKGYFEKIKDNYNIILCDEFPKGFTYRGDPSKREEVKTFDLILRDISPNEEMILFLQAHFIYTFRDVKDISIIVQR